MKNINVEMVVSWEISDKKTGKKISGGGTVKDIFSSEEELTTTIEEMFSGILSIQASLRIKELLQEEVIQMGNKKPSKMDKEDKADMKKGTYSAKEEKAEKAKAKMPFGKKK